MSKHQTILEVSEAARIKRVSPSTIRRMCEARLIVGAFDIGTRSRRHWRIPREALDQVNPLPEEGFEEAILSEEVQNPSQSVTNTPKQDAVSPTTKPGASGASNTPNGPRHASANR